MYDCLGCRLLVLLILYVMVAVPTATSEEDLSHTSVVGFTAWLQYTQIYSEGDTIIFDGGNINEGDGYVPAEGKFYCPVDAVYFVTVNLKRSGLTPNIVQVVIDGIIVLDLYDAYVMSNPENIVSNSALVQCNQGQAISVVGATSGAVYGEGGIQHSTFSVFKMADSSPLGLHNDTVIGFSAYLMGDDVAYFANETILFTGIIYNSGYYNPETGEFFCPVSGYYFINTNLQKFAEDPLALGVSLDDTEIVLHSEEPLTFNYYNTISNSRFIECSQGQILSVKAIEEGSVYGSRCTTFSVMYIGEKADSSKHAGLIGFTASKDSNQIYGPGDAITFDKILVNEGGHFDGTVFTCPSTSMYFLSVNYKKVDQHRIYLNVVQGSTIMFRSEESYTGNQLNTVSNSGLFRCLRGEEVKVQGYESGRISGDPDMIFSTFSIMMMSSL